MNEEEFQMLQVNLGLAIFGCLIILALHVGGLFRPRKSKRDPKQGYAAPLPENEAERLAELHQLHIMDTDAEPEYDEVTALAARVFDTPISLISLVDDKRQWFKSKVGLDPSETPRDISFCQYAILEPKEVFVVEDAHLDDRFGPEHPLVKGYPRLRFYAGAPVVTPQGNALGTLCIIDRKPRVLTELQKETLSYLAKQISGKFDELSPTLTIDTPIFALRKSGRIVFVNKYAVSVFLPSHRNDKSGGDLLKKMNIQDLIHPEERTQFRCFFAEYVKHRKDTRNCQQYTIINHDGVPSKVEILLGISNHKSKNRKERGEILCMIRDVLTTSRYQTDFEELGTLGKGTFGAVKKCRNKLDGQTYAIKIIPTKEAPTAAFPRINPLAAAAASADAAAAIEDEEEDGDDDDDDEEEKDGTQPRMEDDDKKEEEDTDTEELEGTNPMGDEVSNVIFGIDFGHDFQANFSESRVLASMPSHPNVVSYYACWRENISVGNDILYIQMQLCGSLTLKGYFDRLCDPSAGFRPSTDSQALQTKIIIALQLIEGLDHIHTSGFIHRDIKPENIFVEHLTNNKSVNRQLQWIENPRFENCEKYLCKIGDFGLATRHGPKVCHLSGVGTPLYAAPEQMVTTDYTETVDHYAMGLVLCSLFCPRQFSSPKERHNYLRGIRRGEPVEAVGTMQRVLSRMVSSSPGSRPSLDFMRRFLINQVKEVTHSFGHSASFRATSQESFG